MIRTACFLVGFAVGFAVGLTWMPFWQTVGEVSHDRMFEKGHM